MTRRPELIGPAPVPRPRGATRGLARMAMLTAASNLALPLTSLASGPILARTLGPVQRGEMAAAIAPVFVLMFIANMGLPEAATYGVAALRQNPRAVFLRCAALSLVYGIVTAVGLWFAAPYLLRYAPDAIPVLRTVLLLLPLLMLVILLRATVNGMRRFGAVNAERVGTPLLRLAAFAVLAVAGSLTVMSAALSQVIATVVGGCFLLVVLLRSARAVPGTTAPGLTRTLAAYGLRGWGSVLGNLVNWRLDQLVLVALVSPKQLGLYVVSVHFAEIPSTAVNAVRNLLFAESAHRDEVALVARAARIVSFLATVIAACGVVAAPLMVWILFGSDFSESVPMVQILLVGSIPFCAEQILGAGLLATGRPGRRSMSQMIAAFVTVIGLLVLAPVLGGVGAALTSLIAYSVSFAITTAQFRRLSGLGLRRLLLVDRDDLNWMWKRMRKLRGGRALRKAGVSTTDGSTSEAQDQRTASDEEASR